MAVIVLIYLIVLLTYRAIVFRIVKINPNPAKITVISPFLDIDFNKTLASGIRRSVGKLRKIIDRHEWNGPLPQVVVAHVHLSSRPVRAGPDISELATASASGPPGSPVSGSESGKVDVARPVGPAVRRAGCRSGVVQLEERRTLDPDACRFEPCPRSSPSRDFLESSLPRRNLWTTGPAYPSGRPDAFG